MVLHLSLSRGEPTDLVLFDLFTAFDTNDHSTLLSCLPQWVGVVGSVLKWFTCYLTKHYQLVKIGFALSDLCRLLFGVPQGFVLGLLLFPRYRLDPLSLAIGEDKGM